MASEIKESESPLSQSQRADPPQSQSAAKLNKVYVYFWHAYSSVMYSLYEIEVPKPLPPPPDKATQADEIENPKELLPVLELKTGKYPDGMSCVSLGSKLYFVGGEFNMDNPYIDEDVKKNPKYSERDVFPRQLRILDLSEVGASGYKLHKLRDDDKQMRSGKARPHAFVAEEKIYVIGSTIESSISHRSKLTRLNLESFIYFEVYDPEVGQWHDLPDPPIGKVRTRWVGHAIVRRKALLVAWQGGKERLYCFDLGESRWTDASIPFYPENFSGRTEFVEDTLYGCYHNTIAAIAPIEETKIEKEEKKEKVEAEEGEKMEAEKVKAKETLEVEEEEEDAKDFGQGWLLENLHLRVLSEEMGMDAIFNVPPQLQSSSSLLHLGNRYFCYVKSGMPPNSDDDSDDDIKDDKKRFISIVIFRALGKKYEEDGTGLLQAQFLYSAHYEINSPFPNEGFINGCFFPGSSFSLDKSSGKKCYLLAARELSIAWGSTPEYWRWISLPEESRFPEVAELNGVCWFDIRGKMSTSLLSPKTHYAAYLVYKLRSEAFGFKGPPFKASVGTVGGEVFEQTVLLDVSVMEPNQQDQIILPLRQHTSRPKQREDGWLEIELGQFFNGGGKDDELQINLMEVEELAPKAGLVVEGIEIRPVVEGIEIRPTKGAGQDR